MIKINSWKIGEDSDGDILMRVRYNGLNAGDFIDADDGALKMLPQKIVIASGNAGKVREIRAALSPLVELPSLADLHMTQTAEPYCFF